MASALLGCGRQTEVTHRVFHRRSTDFPTRASLRSVCRIFRGTVTSLRCPLWSNPPIFPPRRVPWTTSRGLHCRRSRWRPAFSRKRKLCLTRLRHLRKHLQRSAFSPEVPVTMSLSPLVVISRMEPCHPMPRNLKLKQRAARLHCTIRYYPMESHQLWGRHQPSPK